MSESHALRLPGNLGVGTLLREFPGQILVTWTLVLVENVLLALIPLFIGRAIDGLLESRAGALFAAASLMGALVFVASLRRVFDTRAYGTMRVRLGSELVARSDSQPVSTVSARLGMSREMVDFLEAHVPELLTATVQIVVSIAILWQFDTRLGLSAASVIGGLAVVYALFHRRFFRLNKKLNAQIEQQVSILETRRATSLVSHL
ncbi:MAG: ABC transporter six-transmembrane domain-containing protein, partial [Pseudomonadota bacterium]